MFRPGQGTSASNSRDPSVRTDRQGDRQGVSWQATEASSSSLRVAAAKEQDIPDENREKPTERDRPGEDSLNLA
jgi:hypothetical protein